ncbi:MAG: hemin receptor [Kordiimonadales bacterium]|nr:MAG: hemin receptor [Kordiimonadales bacterium]
MTPDDVAKLQYSFGQMVPKKDEIAKVFYERLFEVAPAVRPLFKGSIEEQGQKLVMALRQIVLSLKQPNELTTFLKGLGERHVGYGAVAAHYDVVGGVLLWTFENVMGNDFTPELKELWGGAYGVISAAMQEAAASLEPAE